METIINANEVRKELYRSKVNAKFSHYTAGNLYYTVEMSDGTYVFSIPTIEKQTSVPSESIITSMLQKPIIQLSSDLGTTTFSAEIKASELNRWIAKSIEKNDFIKIS